MPIAGDIFLTYSDGNEVTGNRIHYPHTHTYCELYFYLEGKTGFMVENGMFDMTYGTVIFTRPGELHCVQINEPCEYRRFFYDIPITALDFLGGDTLRCFLNRPFGERNSLVLPVETMNEVAARLTRGIGLYTAGSPDQRSVMLADLLYTLNDVNRNFDHPAINQTDMRRNTLVSDTLEYINAHLGEIRSSADIAEALYVSREYLSRTFTRGMNITLTRYITTKRVEHAKNLLYEGILPEEAGERCGFRDYSYFIQVFRRASGVTPYVYKQEIAKKKARGC